MSLEAGDRIGTNRLGVKSYTPAAGNRCCFIGNRAIHTLPVEVGDRIGHRKYGYKSTAGAPRTTCWNSIARMELDLGVSTSTIHADYTTARKYRYEYAHYGGQYGDDYATTEIYARLDKYYCLGYQTDESTASANMNIPAGCDVYLFINGEMVDYILADEFVTSPWGALTNYYRFGNIDAYLKKDGTKERISLYIRPYDGMAIATVVYVDVFEMDYETCLTSTRQTAGFFVTDAWKINDEQLEFTAPVVEWVLGNPIPMTYQEFETTFTAREGCLYALMDMWQYSHATTKYHTENTYYATPGFQFKPPYASFGSTTGDLIDIWVNGTLRVNKPYSVWRDWVYVVGEGGGSHWDYNNIYNWYTIPGENTVKIRYPYQNSLHYWDPYAGQWRYQYVKMEWSAAWMVELQSERILSV
jgi:hypothetical protein